MPNLITAKRLAEIKARVERWPTSAAVPTCEIAELIASYERAVELLRNAKLRIDSRSLTYEDVGNFLKEFDHEAAPSALHGSCCTCQQCGKHHDDCRCSLDEALDRIAELERELNASYDRNFRFRCERDEATRELAVARARLPKLRTAIKEVFGGMFPGSSIWGPTQYDKGYAAGISSALKAIDAAINGAIESRP